MPTEYADAVVVGTRCAGTAVATTLARAGRRVVGLDSAAFPSDTLSTHLLWPAGVAEVEALGALGRVRALGAPALPIGFAAGAGVEVRSPFSAYDGIDYAMCVRRTGLDAALVANARDAGADLREKCRVTELLWQNGRVAGVRYTDREGTRELRAPLVVGADGRRSTVARQVGVLDPYRSAPSGRACYYAYWEDTRAEWRDTAAQWREGDSLGTAFPCDDGLLLCLIQPPVSRPVDRSESAYRAMIAEIPGLAARLGGCTLRGRVRSAVDIVSYFRRSTGPGWALPGDAGHFKDPVTAQGIRDALRYGRLLGEAVAPVLDDPAALDRALYAWERRRELDCLEVYQWTNHLARAEPMSPLEIELYRAAATDPALSCAVMEVMSRVRAPGDILTLPQRALFASRALFHRGHDNALHDVLRDVRDTVAEWHERHQVSRTELPPLPTPPASASLESA
ncbi:flavin-dependent dehydrogenase [Nocardia transvalensis]|uniref:Flavin-dependent dehydrogenase n=1 Tax=Nocardia transvalensis TaxID=37333 RepID=A0A7W9P9L3_9NOCA|nr:NAD(P)/FAD-dependent oxidoreductase [Nocardia transvalensis]MBB5911946.1 flavin-dependent dehydrogenase [Nocardia transvalensis]